MWTHRRTPSPPRLRLRPSSKSFAPSGSIVNASRSRRSTRSGSFSGGSGGSGGNARRSPASHKTPSSPAPTSSGRPRTAATRARPRPSRRTIRSPTDASPADFRSTTIGVPPSKYGSPTRSFPRRESSQTTNGLSELSKERSLGSEKGLVGARRDVVARADVRAHARQMDVLAGRRPVRRRRQLERAAVREEADRLD